MRAVVCNSRSTSGSPLLTSQLYVAGQRRVGLWVPISSLPGWVWVWVAGDVQPHARPLCTCGAAVHVLRRVALHPCPACAAPPVLCRRGGRGHADQRGCVPGKPFQPAVVAAANAHRVLTGLQPQPVHQPEAACSEAPSIIPHHSPPLLRSGQKAMSTPAGRRCAAAGHACHLLRRRPGPRRRRPDCHCARPAPEAAGQPSWEPSTGLYRLCADSGCRTRQSWERCMRCASTEACFVRSRWGVQAGWTCCCIKTALRFSLLCTCLGQGHSQGSKRHSKRHSQGSSYCRSLLCQPQHERQRQGRRTLRQERRAATAAHPPDVDVACSSTTSNTGRLGGSTRRRRRHPRSLVCSAAPGRPDGAGASVVRPIAMQQYKAAGQ